MDVFDAELVGNVVSILLAGDLRFPPIMLLWYLIMISTASTYQAYEQ